MKVKDVLRDLCFRDLNAELVVKNEDGEEVAVTSITEMTAAQIETDIAEGIIGEEDNEQPRVILNIVV